MGRFTDAVEAETDRQQGPKCTVGRALRELPADDAADLAELLASKVTHSRLARALNAEGLLLSQYTIGRHRNGDCQCR